MKRYAIVAMSALALMLLGACAPAHINTEQVGNEGLIAISCDPSSAEVFVDGQYVGRAKDFDGDREHLMLAGGVHIIELRKAGYQTFKKEIYSQRYVQTITVTLSPLPPGQ
ncbi:MAG: PEGA domain-containing protein [Candidatus Alcyoniella australis]|nr:PEGA domain-containing protein [Candidatus Alcyoniella australis]